MVLRVKHVGFHADNRAILTDITFDIAQGEFMAIIGPNGGGKSTLLSLIMGLLPCSEGSIELLGQSPQKGRINVGYLPQFTHWDMTFPLSVLEVVLMSTLKKNLLGYASKSDKHKALSMLEKVGLLHLKDQRIHALSGGEKQRVLLARCFMHNPLFYILDEPTTSVDTHSQVDIYALLRSFYQTTSVLVVTHDLTGITPMVTKIGCLNQTLTCHNPEELDGHAIEHSYGCPIEMIGHGIPHRVLKSHD